MTDDQITMELLEQQRTALARLPKGALRDERMRLNTFGRAALEATGCNNMAEAITLLKELRNAKLAIN